MKSNPLAYRSIAYLVVASLVGGFSAGCASSYVEKSATSPAASGKHFSKMLVIDLARRPENRRLYEDALVKQLQAGGTAAVASCSLLPDAQMTNRAAIQRAAAQSGADGVLVMHLVKLTRQQETLKPSMYMEDYVSTPMPEGYEPTQLQTGTATLKVSLFDAGTRQAVWGSTVEVSAGSLREGMSEASKTIARQLSRDKLL